MKVRMLSPWLAFAVFAAAVTAIAQPKSLPPQENATAKDAEIRWSESVDGLRARLVLKRFEVFNGTPMISVVLVLQNVTDSISPLKLAWSREQMTFRVVDGDGKAIARPSVMSYSGPVVADKLDLILPLRGELSFEINSRGLGVPGDKGAIIDLGASSETCWVIEKDQGDCFMHATLEIPQVRGDTNRAWQGRLELPPVKIPLADEPIDPAKIAARIDELGDQMVSKRGRASEEAKRALSLINDPRVLPWYLKALATKDYELKFAALDRLSRFNSDEALAALEAGLATSGADIGNRTDTDELGDQLASNIRVSAAQGLARSPHPDAKRRLITYWQHPDASVRLDVLHVLGRMESRGSLELIKKMTEDKSEVVRGEAQRYLKLRTEE